MSNQRRPKASILLITYNQELYVKDAIKSALDQGYTPLEVIISDDCSTDDTWREIQEAVHNYSGPHELILNRNPENLGIGAHLSRLAKMATGELLFVAAGDDMSMPDRCKVVVDAWIQADEKPDLISADLVDMDLDGNLHATIKPTDLTGMDLEAWLKDQPYIVGAAHTWHRRLFDTFGLLPKGVVAEDMIMTFRAVIGGGAISVGVPLVKYRRGGVSGRVRAMDAETVVRKIKKNNEHTLIEIPQIIKDSKVVGKGNVLESFYASKLKRELFIQSLFLTETIRNKFLVALRADVSLPVRVRMFTYASFPRALSFIFWCKRKFLSGRV